MWGPFRLGAENSVMTLLVKHHAKKNNEYNHPVAAAAETYGCKRYRHPS